MIAAHELALKLQTTTDGTHKKVNVNPITSWPVLASAL